MEIMHDFSKKHFQGRFYRKPRDIEEFNEDVMEYMLNVQTKKYTQECENRLFKTLMMIGPDNDWERWSTKERISVLDEAGVYLEVRNEKSVKEIQRLKEKKIEQRIKKHTKNMNTIQGLIFRENYLKELQEKEEKQT
jgi:acetyl-CoA carboxylase beta subunit